MSQPPAYQEGMQTASAPPAPDTPMYPVLAQPGGQQPVQQQQQYVPQQPQQAIYGQQPQQVIYANSQPQQQQQQPDESKQLDMDISNKFDKVSQILANKKGSILQTLNNTNNEQKKDLLLQLQKIIDGINMVSIDPNIKPKPKPIPQPVQPKIVYVQQPPVQPVVIQHVQSNVKVVNDTWNIMTTDIILNQQMNSVHRSSKGGWVNAFGAQVINKGQYKKWDIKVLPKFVVRNAKQSIADIVIGIADSKLVQRIGARKGGFWLKPQYGYGFYGFNGKKFHVNKKGAVYTNKYCVNDTISVEINMQAFSLNFYTNGISHGKAYGLDATRTYVLAVSFCNSDYDAQIL